MSKQQKAMRLALEALELSMKLLPDVLGGKRSNAAIALRAALAEPDTCTWQQDGDRDSGVYGTSCRRYFNLEDGTPEDNKMAWCCYCGKKLAQELITEDEDE